MGIKSFQGPRKKQTVDEVPLTVNDYMTRKLITFRPDQSVEEVIEALIRYKISGGPVVNEKNELVGMISEGDCVKHISESRYHNSLTANRKVEHHMVKNVETIDGHMNIFDAANKFLNDK
ncbi:MAG: CBS domain-containing protein, partial [Pricia sp.]|nr:CBS domain-containing protein [Pricia sp.]